MDITAPFTMTVAGPSGCGKTMFVLNFVHDQRNLFTKIYYCYGIYQDQVEEFSKLGAICSPNLPVVECSQGDSVLVLFDDLVLGNTKEIAKFFIQMRHAHLSSIFLTQSFFFNDKFLRLITRNSNYIALFKCPRDASIP